jgi:hypothetical protein
MMTQNNSANTNSVWLPLLQLLSYCRQNDWAGHDPYDAVNSKFFTALPILDRKLPRLVMTQALKLSPINVRRLLAIPKTQNPKALALFLSSFLAMSPNDLPDRDRLIKQMIQLIAAKRSPNSDYWCWGYSFPWQTRKDVVPRWAPNLVCTTFVGLALLDAYDQTGDPSCLEMALSAAEYMVNDLYWTEGDTEAGFSYPQPNLRSKTHNANFLAAAFLCRVHKLTHDGKFLSPALRGARYSASRQRPDGSWLYGDAPTQSWIDNFHTGYNLRALQTIARYAETTEFDSSVRRGYEFYRGNFFREDGSVKYFHDRTYPIDIHCVAESIITLLAFNDTHPANLAQAHAIFQWAMQHMWDRRGFFYYRILRFGKIRTSYMRWSQAWMLLALSQLHAATIAAPSVPPESRLTDSSTPELATHIKVQG